MRPAPSSHYVLMPLLLTNGNQATRVPDDVLFLAHQYIMIETVVFLQTDFLQSSQQHLSWIMFSTTDRGYFRESRLLWPVPQHSWDYFSIDQVYCKIEPPALSWQKVPF